MAFCDVPLACGTTGASRLIAGYPLSTGAPTAAPGIFGSVCIFVYVGADHPLEVPGDSALRLTKLKQRVHKKLLCGEHAYLALGCACALTLDGADEDDKAERQALLDALEVFLTAATAEGPVYALVTDGSRAPLKQVAVSVADFRDFDFGSAWDAPSLLTVRSG